MLTRAILIVLATGSLSVAAEPSAVTLDFTAETSGAASTTAPALVGAWTIAADGQNRVLKVDGQHWQHDQLPAALAPTATVLFADRGVAFADRIRARPDFPLAAVPAISDFRTGTISVRFKPLAGSADQAAGIAFSLDAKADYLLVRANALEDNIGFFHVVNGSRSTIQWVEKTPTPANQWHTLLLTITATNLTVSLDGTSYLTHTLPAPVSGKIALWSKEDSVVLFDDLIVTPGKP